VASDGGKLKSDSEMKHWFCNCSADAEKGVNVYNIEINTHKKVISV